MHIRIIPWLLASLILLLPIGSTAQDTTAAAIQLSSATVITEQTTQTVRKLLAIQQALEEKRARVRELLEQLETADEVDEQKIRVQIDDTRNTITTLTRSFEAVAANGINLRDLEQGSDEELSWDDQLMQIAQPLLNSLKEATEKPRRIEELRREIALYQQQYQITRQAVSALAQFDQVDIPTEVAEGLSELAANWQERSSDIERTLSHARDDLQSLEAEEIDVVATLLAIAEEFVLGRGLTLLIALITGLGLWFAMRSLRQVVTSRRRPRDDSERAARIRLLLYGYHLLTMVLVSLGVLTVFYVRGDLLLLSLSIIALVMLALGTWRYLPRYLQEGRLLLNVGAAREGERVDYEGIPYRITSLNLYSDLRNPQLEGVIRLPLSTLAQLISRPRGSESWFPSQVGDYLLLADGSFAQVLRQTIDWVHLKVMGSEVQIRSADFLQQPVRNISSEGFGIAVTFGIDYRHQDIALGEVPQALQDAIGKAFNEAEFGASLKDLQVEFKAAGVNSLDYLIYASMDGKAAAYYFVIDRLVQQACLAVCSERGWGIPFNQLTLHQVESAAPTPRSDG